MKKLNPVFFVWSMVAILSCTKDYSVENGDGNNPQIIGEDCRISKIAYIDSTSGRGIGSISAVMNSDDNVTNVTKFDSLGMFIEFMATPVYLADTVYINANDYFIRDLVTKRINKFSGLIDPTDPASIRFETHFVYNAAGYLVTKNYDLTNAPGIYFYIVNYTYTGNNLTHMAATDVISGDLIMDADITYYTNIVPRHFLYIFPDEKIYPDFTQFYHFGNKPVNAVQSIKVRNYDPGNIVRDSAVSTFDHYMMSVDNYVLSVMMREDDQPGIPAVASRLTFSYSCK